METTDSPIPAAPKTSGMAIASLITGLTCVSPVAILLGHMALSRIKKSAGQLGGGGLALAGTILGYVGLVALVLFIIPALFVGAKAWKMGSDRAACLMMQRNIEAVVLEYQTENGLQPGAALDVEAIKQKLGGEAALKCPVGATIVIFDTVQEEGDPVCECPYEDGLGHMRIDMSK